MSVTVEEYIETGLVLAQKKETGLVGPSVLRKLILPRNAPAHAGAAHGTTIRDETGPLRPTRSTDRCRAVPNAISAPSDRWYLHVPGSL